jgi:hypothetical protein
VKSHFYRYLVFGVLLIFSISACAEEIARPSPAFDISAWLQRSNRADLPWKVTLIKPRLTLQQRYLVQVSALIYTARLRKRNVGRDLNFVLKVADSDGNWVPGYSYTHLPMPAGLPSYYEIQCVTGIYLRPGKYTIALVLYEANLKQGNVWKKSLEVKAMKEDPLPDLDRDLPRIEFISGTPEYVMGSGMSHAYLDSVWPLGKGMEWLPVANKSDMFLDIVVNVSFNMMLRGQSMQQWWVNYPINAAQMVQAASVLSHLRLNKGRIRISIVDVMNMKTIFDREDAQGFDWRNAGEVVRKQNRFTIDIDRLSFFTQVSAYFQAKLNEILEDGSSASSGGAPHRVLIVVSNQQEFPEKTPIIKVVPQNPESTRLFYFCVNNRFYISGDINEMLKSAAQKRFNVRQPRDFRKALSDLILELEKY